MSVFSLLIALLVSSLTKPFETLEWRRRSEHTETWTVRESFSSSRQIWVQKWSDFSTPWIYSIRNNFDVNETDLITSLPPRPCHVLHVCFLMHGHRGYSHDLGYLSSQMRRVAKAEMERQDQNISSEIVHDMVVHATVCNEKKTTDGVENGGERAVQEMLDVIRESVIQRQGLETGSIVCSDITISVVGNSLGGIYGRYAIAKLAERWNCTTSEDDPMVMLMEINNRTYRLHYNIFCTTATPHLGVAGHTFLPIPRSAEIGVAHAMGNTGRDLFRLNDLLKNMATAREYTEPLGRFCQRIAYANAFGTDFPVPAHTAAFLSETSTYPHHFFEDDEQEVVIDDNGLVVATLRTPVSSEYSQSSLDDHRVETSDEDSDERDELELMSQSLDSLGWKKVFIDVRKAIPRISLPTSFIRKTMTQIGGTDQPGGDNMSNSEPPLELLTQLKLRGVVGSKDIAAAVTTPLFDEQFHWPMGHNMMVAFSRSKLSSYLNKAGRPVVDALAKALVEDIFAWQLEQHICSSRQQKV